MFLDLKQKKQHSSLNDAENFSFRLPVDFYARFAALRSQCRWYEHTASQTIEQSRYVQMFAVKHSLISAN